MSQPSRRDVLLTLGVLCALPGCRHAVSEMILEGKELGVVNADPQKAGDQVKGSGVSGRQERQVPTFRSITLAGAYEARVVSGRAQRVTITADDNVLPLIKTEVKGDTLKVYTDKSYSTQRPVRVEISLQSLRAFTSAGSSDVKIEGIDTDQLSLDLAGSGNITASGRARSLKSSVSGSGNLSTTSLQAQDSNVTISGSGNAEVSVSGSLRASVAGSGNVRYRAKPRSVKSTVAGSGQVSPLG